jgi:endonuclease YncB( thermonuclease family)
LDLTQRARLWHPSIASAAGSLIGSQPTGVWAVSLNHRRRIFRPGTGPAPLRHRRRPSPGLWLAASGGAATLLTATWLFIRSSDAPAHGPASTHVAASADSLAVLDGDTMRVGDQVVRLHGIAAPRRGSVCHSGATQVDCGAAAANALAALVRGRAVDCIVKGHDGQGRPVADCVAHGVGLSEAQVRNGWARAQGAALQASEEAAKAAGRGIWRTSNPS